MALRRWFGRKQVKTVAKPIEEMTWLEIGDDIKARADGAGVLANDLIPYFRRLTDIALFDRATSHKDREHAASLAVSLRQDIEAALAPDALAAFQQAADYHVSRATHFGYGSLHWLLEERSVPTPEIVDFIVRPEYAPLLPAYLHMQSPEFFAQHRRVLLRAMVDARKDGSDESPLQVLHGLALSGDEALPYILTKDELVAITRSTENFEASTAIVKLLIGE